MLTILQISSFLRNCDAASVGEKQKFGFIKRVDKGLWYCIYIRHFLFGYIHMRFTTLCGVFCQTALWRSLFTIFFFFFFYVTSIIHRCPPNRINDARPQHRELHALRSNRSDEGRTLETSAFLIFHGGNSTNQLL